MLYFTVTVHPQRIEVQERIKEIVMYDYKAIVDGIGWLYKIKKHANVLKNDKRWRERAILHIHYHAHNSGTHVLFEPRYYDGRRKRKIHDKQLSLL